MKTYKLPEGAVAVAKGPEGKWEAFVCQSGSAETEGAVWRLPDAETPGEALEAALSAAGFEFVPDAKV